MKYTVTQVGRRWFKVKAEVSTERNGCESIAVVVDVEAMLYRSRIWKSHEFKWEDGFKFTIVGLGSRKYNEGINEALTNFLAPKDMPF